MIQLNLIEVASRAASIEPKVQVSANLKNRSSRGSRKFLYGLVAIAASLAIALGSLVIFGLPKPLYGIIPEAMLVAIGVEDPSREALQSRSEIGQTTTAGGLLEKQRDVERAALQATQAVNLKNLVQEVSPRLFIQAPRSSYFSYLPLERIAYQNAALSQLLVFVNTATPDNISFSDFIFEAPNYYFVRGVAETPLLQRSFLERLRAVSGNFKTPLLPENAPATDITAFGEYKVTIPDLKLLKKLVSADAADQEVKAFVALDVIKKIKFSGLEKPAIENFGVYKKYTYVASTNADFATIMNFMVELEKSTVRIGIQKLEMTPGKKGLFSLMNLVMYVAP